jgi:iron complex outermembrane receptor protein
MRKPFQAFLFASAAALAAQSARAEAPAAAPSAAAETDRVAEIVVTAQKREQSLQDVPISISAIDQNTITANRIRQVTDLSAVAPNLTVREGAGGSLIPQYSLRGIYTFGTAPGTDKGVSLYLDGVYIQNVAGSIFEFADVERIEVLKGPQGTLFGRNATGGAVSVITRNPSGQFGVQQEFTAGNYAQFRSKTRVDLPQIGPMSATVSYLHSQRDGDTRNLGAGTVWDHGPATGGHVGKLTSPARLGDDNTDAVFVAARFDLRPDVDLTYKFDYSQRDYTPTATGVDYLANAGTLAFGGVPATFQFASVLYNLSPNPMTPVTDKRPGAVNNAFSTPAFTRSHGHNLTAVWHLNDKVSLKNILAQRATYLASTFQLDGLGGLIVPTGAGNLPFAFVVNNSEQIDSQWSDEFQVNASSKFVDLTAGLIHFHSHTETAGFEGEFNTLQGTVLIGQNTPLAGTPFVVPGNTGYRHTVVSVNSDAFYMQPEVHVTDAIDIVAGFRVTHDQKDGVESFPGTVDAPSNGAGTPVRYRDTEVTWTAGVDYKPTSDVLLYGKYATGYISGGQLATIVFKPETAKSFEVGAKTELLEHRLRSNLAVFHVKYGAIQQATLGSLTGIPSAEPFSQAIVSSGNATAEGFEWENTFVPTHGLTLGANVGYTNFHFDQSTIFPGFIIEDGIPGYQVEQRPKWTGNLSAQYRTEEVAAGGHLSFRADANFKSKSLLSSDLSPGSGPTAQEDPALRAAATAPFQWIVNARIAFEDFELAGGRGQLALWGRNLLNNRDITQFTGLGLAASVLYQPARTWGVDLTVNF